MGKSLLWIIPGVIAVVIFVLAFNYVREKAKPLVMSPAELQQMETGALKADDMVVITMDDNLYHRPGCPKIRGVSERTSYETALRKEVHPCPYCVSEDGY